MSDQQNYTEFSATYKEPCSGGLYKKIDGIWHVFSRFENEPKRWIRTTSTCEKYLVPIDFQMEIEGVNSDKEKRGETNVT